MRMTRNHAPVGVELDGLSAYCQRFVVGAVSVGVVQERLDPAIAVAHVSFSVLRRQGHAPRSRALSLFAAAPRTFGELVGVHSARAPERSRTSARGVEARCSSN